VSTNYCIYIYCYFYHYFYIPIMLDRELLKREESPISAIPGSPRLGIRRPRSGSDANLSPSPSPYLRRRAATPSMCCSLVCTFVLVLIVLSLSLSVCVRAVMREFFIRSKSIVSECGRVEPFAALYRYG
jgi:hypothetical protein